MQIAIVGISILSIPTIIIIAIIDDDADHLIIIMMSILFGMSGLLFSFTIPWILFGLLWAWPITLLILVSILYVWIPRYKPKPKPKMEKKKSEKLLISEYKKSLLN